MGYDPPIFRANVTAIVAASARQRIGSPAVPAQQGMQTVSTEDPEDVVEECTVPWSLKKPVPQPAATA